jgi:hypothetical protein
LRVEEEGGLEEAMEEDPGQDLYGYPVPEAEEAHKHAVAL